MFRTLITFFCLGLLFLTAAPLYAQKTPQQQDFSNVRVDDLTDAQIRTFMKQAEASGLGEDQYERIAAARGMSDTEIIKLRKRVENLKRREDREP